MTDTYDNLLSFISKKMKMSHIYQPVMLSALMNKDGYLSTKDLAKFLSSQDPSQIEYYENVVKNMVGKVLSNHSLVSPVKEGQKISGFEMCNYDSISDQERETLIALCEDKLSEFLHKRGEAIWDHRRRSRRAISGSIRYKVFKRAKLRCELCGVLEKDKALEVDHIIPKNKGGSDDISNFQALCYSCNAAKGDRDDADLRGISQSYSNRDKDCLFCNLSKGRPIIAENELCYAIEDGYPVTDKHMLIIPKRHVDNYFSLYQPEINSINAMMSELQLKLEKDDPDIRGFNIGLNCGEVAGQTVMHCHVHLIPRRVGDVDDPRGGVRGVIPDKQKY